MRSCSVLLRALERCGTVSRCGKTRTIHWRVAGFSFRALNEVLSSSAMSNVIAPGTRREWRQKTETRSKAAGRRKRNNLRILAESGKHRKTDDKRFKDSRPPSHP